MYLYNYLPGDGVPDHDVAVQAAHAPAALLHGGGHPVVVVQRAHLVRRAVVQREA